ncbi:hypothetical protein GCM10010145_14960 [Streptomyces ruber]|uniref:Uncharacterized protein n=2 Tax=Streptomyces TaxID=1883 RepID=A0A918B997_9ACTN|nr:hypothetical protein GCM10010145_14960 [Streptomyces ruber]
MASSSAEPAEEETARCAHHDGHGPGSDAEAPESPRERVNRRWNEVLQETRVTQTGVQILFGFLLSVAFTPLFNWGRWTTSSASSPWSWARRPRDLSWHPSPSTVSCPASV